MRPPRALRPLLAAAFIAGSVLGLVACGSGDTASTTAATRGASGGTSCPEQSGSKGDYLIFVNDLGTNVTLDVPRDSWTCAGFSGVSTPGRIDGRTIGLGRQPRTRFETVADDSGVVSTQWTMKVRAANRVLVSLNISKFPYSGGTGNRWGLEIDGKRWCEPAKAVVEFRNVDGQPAWATLPNGCNRSAEVQLLFTTVKPL